MTDWTNVIHEMVRAKRRVERSDREGLAPFAPPRAPADQSRLRLVAERAGGALDRQYAEFLRHADGWPGLLLPDDILFGTPELLGPEFGDARELLDMLEPDILPDAGCRIGPGPALPDRHVGFG
jgi:hypothetical protein